MENILGLRMKEEAMEEKLQVPVHFNIQAFLVKGHQQGFLDLLDHFLEKGQEFSARTGTIGQPIDILDMEGKTDKVLFILAEGEVVGHLDMVDQLVY